MDPPSENIGDRARIDADALSEIPIFQRPLTIVSQSSSAWAHSYRITIGNDSYFMKVSFSR
jgi:hypothetical protein